MELSQVKAAGAGQQLICDASRRKTYPHDLALADQLQGELATGSGAEGASNIEI